MIEEKFPEIGSLNVYIERAHWEIKKIVSYVESSTLRNRPANLLDFRDNEK